MTSKSPQRAGKRDGICADSYVREVLERFAQSNLAATALYSDLPIISRDRRIRTTRVKTIW